ncbi:MAG TPA: hypothetical protein DEP57_10205 [Selenomonas sp.]|nr:hypothetical protein [Selenomonas sp.]
MATSIETMKAFMNVLKQYAYDTTTSGITILDNAVRAVSRFTGLQDAINAFVNDVTDTSRTPDTAQRLKETCGIILGPDNDFSVDTGSVSGANAGNGVVKNAVDIVPETGTLLDLSMPEGGSVTKHSYTTSDGQTFSFNIQWPTSFTQVVDRKWQTTATYNPEAWTTEELTNQTYYSDLNNNQDTKTYTAQQLKDSIETITKGMEHWWVDESAKLIYDSYGVDFNGKTLKVEYFVNQDNIQADTGPADKKDNDTTPANVISMAIALPLYGKIDPVDVNGNTRIEDGLAQCYLDRTIAHEMVHAVMQGSGTLKSYEPKTSSVASMPEFFTEGVAELVMGLDDYDGQNKANILALANNRENLKNAMVLASGTGTSIRYASGYMFLRYLCQQGLDNRSEEAGTSSPGELSPTVDDLLPPSASQEPSVIYTNAAQETLSNIDARGKDYAMNLVMGAMSGHALQTLPQ